MSVTVDKKGVRTLKPLQDFLKASRQSRRPSLDEGFGRVAAFLDRKIKKQEQTEGQGGDERD